MSFEDYFVDDDYDLMNNNNSLTEYVCELDSYYADYAEFSSWLNLFKNKNEQETRKNKKWNSLLKNTALIGAGTGGVILGTIALGKLGLNDIILDDLNIRVKRFEKELENRMPTIDL